MKEYTVCCFRDHSFAQKSVNFFSSLKAIDHKTSMTLPQQKREGKIKGDEEKKYELRGAPTKKRNRSFGGDEEREKEEEFPTLRGQGTSPRRSWCRDFTGGGNHFGCLEGVRNGCREVADASRTDALNYFQNGCLQGVRNGMPLETDASTRMPSTKKYAGCLKRK